MWKDSQNFLDEKKQDEAAAMGEGAGHGTHSKDFWSDGPRWQGLRQLGW